jgi:hypothetical protein
MLLLVLSYPGLIDENIVSEQAAVGSQRYLPDGKIRETSDWGNLFNPSPQMRFLRICGVSGNCLNSTPADLPEAHLASWS